MNLSRLTWSITPQSSTSPAKLALLQKTCGTLLSNATSVICPIITREFSVWEIAGAKCARCNLDDAQPLAMVIFVTGARNCGKGLKTE